MGGDDEEGGTKSIHPHPPTLSHQGRGVILDFSGSMVMNPS